MKTSHHISSPRATMEIVCGLPGAGNTTLARQLEQQLDAVRMCPDEWLVDLGLDLFESEKRDLVERRLAHLAGDLLSKDVDVVIEFGSWRRRERDALRALARDRNAAARLHCLYAPADELWKRLEARIDGPRVTDRVTREDFQRWSAQFETPEAAELALYDDQPTPARRHRAAGHLIQMCGLPGSGKTTMAKRLASERAALRLSTDEWQADLAVDWADLSFHDKLEVRLCRLVKELLLRGVDVVFEKGMWQRSERDNLRQEAAEAGFEVELHVMDVPIDVLVARLESRRATADHGAFPVTESEIREYDAKYFQRPDAAELALFTRAVVHAPGANPMETRRDPLV